MVEIMTCPRMPVHREAITLLVFDDLIQPSAESTVLGILDAHPGDNCKRTMETEH
jgi:hypothetical protein